MLNQCLELSVYQKIDNNEQEKIKDQNDKLNQQDKKMTEQNHLIKGIKDLINDQQSGRIDDLAKALKKH